MTNMVKAKTQQLNLKIYPDEVLKQVCSPVEHFNGELKDIFHEMLELMRIHKGIGLAAPQVGITKRLFVCEIQDQILFLVNPVISITSGKSTAVEGCLSLPGTLSEVTRSEQILVKGLDPEGRVKRLHTTGLWARVIQHETDHLDGILINERGTIVEEPGKNKRA